MTRPRWMVSGLVAIVAACGSTDTSKPPGPVATIAITPATASLPAGSTLQLQAALKDASGHTLTDRVITWTTSDTSIVRVSSSGLLTGTGVGSATITAAAEGRAGTATAAVTLSSPVVLLDSAYYVSADSALLWGSVNGWGQSYQILYHVATNATFAPGDSSGVATGSKSDGWGWTYSNLAGGTLYYYRIVARNAAGTTMSAARSFTTKPAGAPRIDRIGSDSVGPGFVRYLVDGGANGAATMLDFQYGTSATSFNDLSGCDTLHVGYLSRFSWWCRSSGYLGSTTYWYRVVATSSAGTTTSAVGTFTTLPATAPAITQLTTDSLSSSMVRIWGWVVPNGADATVSFQWGTSASSLATLANCTVNMGLLPDWRGCRVSALTAGTTYYWRVVASNTAGTTSSNPAQLATLASRSIVGGVAPAGASVPRAEPIGTGAAAPAGRAGRSLAPPSATARPGAQNAPRPAAAPRDR